MNRKLSAVRRAAANAASASNERNRAIREASASGIVISEIAIAAGLSRSRIHQILHGL
jgi:hypothetical protein